MSNSDLVFPPAVRRAQAERGTAQAYEKKIAHGFPDTSLLDRQRDVRPVEAAGREGRIVHPRRKGVRDGGPDDADEPGGSGEHRAAVATRRRWGR